MENAENPFKSRRNLNSIQNENLQKISSNGKKCPKWLLRSWMP